MFFSRPTNPKPFIRVLGKLAVLITNSNASNHQLTNDNEQFYLDDIKRSKVKEFFRKFKSLFLRKVQTQIPEIQLTAVCMFQFNDEITVDSFNSEEEVLTLALKPLLKTESPSTVVSTADVVNECPIVDTFELPAVTADHSVPNNSSDSLVVPAESIAAPIAAVVVESACSLESSEPTETAPESVPITVTTGLATEKIPDLSRSNRKKFKKFFKGIRCSIHRTKNDGFNSQPHTFVGETAEVRKQLSVVDVTVEKCGEAEVENVRSKRQRMKNLFRKSKSKSQPTTLERESPEVKEQPSVASTIIEKKALQKVSKLSINESSINRPLTIGPSKSVLPAIASAIDALKSIPVVKLPTASAAVASSPVIAFDRSWKCASAFDPSKKVYPVSGSGSLTSVAPAKTSKPVIPNFTSDMACTGLSWNTQIGSSKDAMKWRDQNSQLGNRFGIYMGYNQTSTGYNNF